MNVNFGSIYSTLTKSRAELPVEVVEVCKLTCEQYCAIRNALAPPDQEVIDEHYRSSLQSSNPQNTIANLQGIRAYQLLSRFTEGLAENSAKAVLIESYNKLSLFDKISIGDRLISSLDKLPTVYARRSFIAIMRQIAAESREETAASVIELAACSGSVIDVARVSLLIKDVTGSDLLTYIINLGSLGRYCPSLLSEISLLVDKDKKVQSAERLRVILSNLLIELTPDQIHELFHVVVANANSMQLFNASRIVSKVTDGINLSSIVNVIANIEEEMNDAIINELCDIFPEPVPSNELYRELLERYNLHRISRLVAPILEALGQNVSVVFIPGQLHDPDFQVTREDFELHPCQVMRNFIEFLEINDASSFAVRFLDEEGVGEGVNKEFISQLTAGVAKALNFAAVANGLMRPEKIPTTKEEKQSLRDLGALFQFCLESDQNYITGIHFDSSLFTALVSIKREHCTTKIDEASFDLFFALYEKMRGHNEDDIAAINLMKESFGKPPVEGVPSAKEVLLESMSKAILPCIEIVQGMQ